MYNNIERMNDAVHSSGSASSSSSTLSVAHAVTRSSSADEDEDMEDAVAAPVVLSDQAGSRVGSIGARSGVGAGRSMSLVSSVSASRQTSSPPFFYASDASSSPGRILRFASRGTGGCEGEGPGIPADLGPNRSSVSLETFSLATGRWSNAAIPSNPEHSAEDVSSRRDGEAGKAPPTSAQLDKYRDGGGSDADPATQNPLEVVLQEPPQQQQQQQQQQRQEVDSRRFSVSLSTAPVRPPRDKRCSVALRQAGSSGARRFAGIGAHRLPFDARLLPTPTHGHRVLETRSPRHPQRISEGVDDLHFGSTRPTEGSPGDAEEGFCATPPVAAAMPGATGFAGEDNTAFTGVGECRRRRRSLADSVGVSRSSVSTTDMSSDSATLDLIAVHAEEVELERLHNFKSIGANTFDKLVTLNYEDGVVEERFLHFVFQHDEAEVFTFLAWISIVALTHMMIAYSALSRAPVAEQRSVIRIEVALFGAAAGVPVLALCILLPLRFARALSFGRTDGNGARRRSSLSRTWFVRIASAASRVSVVVASALAAIGARYSAEGCCSATAGSRFFTNAQRRNDTTLALDGTIGSDVLEWRCTLVISPVLPVFFAIALMQNFPRFVDFIVSLVMSWVAFVLSHYVVRPPQPSSSPFLHELTAVTVVLLTFAVLRFRQEARVRGDFEAVKHFTLRARLVGEQKGQLNALVQRLFPPLLAMRLIGGGGQWVDRSDVASCVMVTIPDFASLSVSMLGPEMASMIAHIHLALSAVAEAHRIQRIRAVGEAFFATSNLLLPNPQHATTTVAFAIDAATRLGQQFRVCAGVHSGTLIGAVVGIGHVRYDMQGVALVGSRRLASAALPGEVLVSAVTRALVKHPLIVFTDAGHIVNGRTTMGYFKAFPLPPPPRRLRQNSAGNDNNDDAASEASGASGAASGSDEVASAAAAVGHRHPRACPLRSRGGGAESSNSDDTNCESPSSGAAGVGDSDGDSVWSDAASRRRMQRTRQASGGHHQRRHQRSHHAHDGQARSGVDRSMSSAMELSRENNLSLGITSLDSNDFRAPERLGPSACSPMLILHEAPPAALQTGTSAGIDSGDQSAILTLSSTDAAPGERAAAEIASGTAGAAGDSGSELPSFAPVALQSPQGVPCGAGHTDSAPSQRHSHRSSRRSRRHRHGDSQASSTSMPVLGAQLDGLLLSVTQAGISESVFHHFTRWEHHSRLLESTGTSSVAAGDPGTIVVTNPLRAGGSDAAEGLHERASLAGATVRAMTENEQCQEHTVPPPPAPLQPQDRVVSHSDSLALQLQRHHLFFWRFGHRRVEESFQLQRVQVSVSCAVPLCFTDAILAALSFLRMEYPSDAVFSAPHAALAVATIALGLLCGAGASLVPRVSLPTRRLLLQVASLVLPALLTATATSSHPSAMAGSVVWLYPIASLTINFSPWALGAQFLAVRAGFEGAFLALALLTGSRAIDTAYVAYAVILFVLNPWLLSRADRAMRRGFAAKQSIVLIAERRAREDTIRRGILLATLPPAIFELVSQGQSGPEELSELVAVAINFFTAPEEEPGGGVEAQGRGFRDPVGLRDVMEPIEGALAPSPTPVLCVVRLFGDAVAFAGPVTRARQSRDQHARAIISAIGDAAAVFAGLLHRSTVPATAGAHIGPGFALVSGSKYPTFEVLGQAMATTQQLCDAAEPGVLAMSQALVHAGTAVLRHAARELSIAIGGPETWQVRGIGDVRVQRVTALAPRPRKS